MSTIVTFDGKFWHQQDLLANMMDDSFYYGYLGQNALSSSVCKDLLDSPKKYQDRLNKREDLQAFRDGTLFHYRVLEPEKWNDLHFVDVSSKNTKIYKEALSEYGASRTFTLKEKHQAEDLAEVALSNSKVADMLNGVRTEVPAVGEIFGMPFRAKADILGGDYIVDLKTTSIREGGSLKDFRWSANKFSYDMQLYIYCNLFNISYKNFTFVVVDKTSKGLGIFECSKDFYESGKFKTEQAVNIYRDFFVDKKKQVKEFYLYDVL